MENSCQSTAVTLGKSWRLTQECRSGKWRSAVFDELRSGTFIDLLYWTASLKFKKRPGP